MDVHILTKIRLDNIGITLHLVGCACCNDLTEVEHENPISDVHHERHIVFNKDHRNSKLLSDVENEPGHVLGLLEIHTSKAETSNEEYWRLLSETDILVTTTMQVRQPQYDWSWEPQVLFRYTEALAVGTALVATSVPGLERHLQAGCHYAVYESLEDCANVVESLLASRVERELLANRGHRRLISLVESRCFWSQVDASLGRNSMK